MSGSQTSGCSPEQREQMIAEAAYRRAQQRDFQGGDPVNDWLEAEREVDRMLSESASAEDKPSAVSGLVQQLESRIKGLDQDMARLMERARGVQADVREDIERELERLKPLRAAAEQRLTELRGRSGVALEEIKKSADRAWEEIGATVRVLTNRIKASAGAGKKQTKAQPKTGEPPRSGSK
jgi:chromosome segregation ATPase